jgi:hypothetical protein
MDFPKTVYAEDLGVNGLGKPFDGSVISYREMETINRFG